MSVLVAVALLLVLLKDSSAVPLSSFYPYGRAVGDTRLHDNDDDSSSVIMLSRPFSFFGTRHLRLFVSFF